MKSPVWQDVPQSSNIASASHDPATNEMLVRFRGGETYRYIGVSAGTFQSMLSSPSPGGFLNRSIVPRHGKGTKI